MDWMTYKERTKVVKMSASELSLRQIVLIFNLLLISFLTLNIYQSELKVHHGGILHFGSVY